MPVSAMSKKCADELGQEGTGRGTARAYRAKSVLFAMTLSHRFS